MSTTCQAIYVRAKRFHPKNDEQLPAPSEVLARIEAEQQALYATIAAGTRDRFKTTATLTSTSGASARSVDLSTLSTPLVRLLKVSLPDGTEVSQVDELDTDAELSPRYFVRAQTLVEVSNDWSATSGPVTLSLVYVYGPTALTVTGEDYTQLVSIPDQWTDLLVIPLAMYFHEQDSGNRDPAEYDRMKAKLADRQEAFVAYLQAYGGIEARRFNVPNPTGTKK